MTQNDLIDIIKIRVCVGLLGEAQQSPWWPSTFFSSHSMAFLSPVFGKTAFYARYYGVKEAAALVHDEHIGIGKGVFHLFRLPEVLEIELHELLRDPKIQKDVQAPLGNKEEAEQLLQDYAESFEVEAIGPVRVAETMDLTKKCMWHIVAQYYLTACHNGTKIFPYFSEKK